VEWNRFKIMIGGTGRAGKTALSRNMIGESFNERLESTIGINGFEVNVNEVGSNLSAKGDCLDNNWKKYEERIKLLEGAVVKFMMREAEIEKKRKEENLQKSGSIESEPSADQARKSSVSEASIAGKQDIAMKESSTLAISSQVSADISLFDEKIMRRR
jgi:GTPase SAR1 family protein